MLKQKVQLDRDEFVEALACWMRWRGHAIPHNMLSERFPIANGAAEFHVFKKIAQHLGIQITYKTHQTKLPKPERFPLIAVMRDHSVRAIRQTDMQGRLVASQVGGDAAIVSSADVLGWITVTASQKRMHQEILGVDNIGARWFWDAFTAI